MCRKRRFYVAVNKTAGVDMICEYTRALRISTLFPRSTSLVFLNVRLYHGDRLDQLSKHSLSRL